MKATRCIEIAGPRGVAAALALGALLLCALGAWAAPATLTGVRVVESGTAATVELSVAGHPAFQAERRVDPLRYVMHLADALATESVLAAPSVETTGGSPVSRVLVLDSRAEGGQGTGTTVVVYLDDRRPVRAAYRADGILAIAINGPLDLEGPAQTPLLSAPPAATSHTAPITVAEPVLGTVVVASAGNGCGEIVLRTDGAARYDARPVGDLGYELYLRGASATAGLEPDWVCDRDGLVRDVRVERVIDDGIALRVTLDLSAKADCSVSPSADGRELTISVKPLGSPAPVAPEALPQESPQDGVAVTDIASAPSGGDPDWRSLGGEPKVAQGGSQTIPGPRRPTSSGAQGRGPAEGIGQPLEGAGARFEPGPSPGLARTPAFLSEGRISLDFPNTAVDQALMAIANYGDVDIVIDDSAQGTIAVTMTDVTPEEAIDTICGIKELVWVKRNDRTYIVASPDAIKRYLATSERIVENYYPAHQDEASLTQYTDLLRMLHPRVFVQKYSDPGVLVLAGDAAEVSLAMASLRKADAARDQGVYSLEERVELCSLESGNASELAAFMTEVFGQRLEVIHRKGTQQVVLKGPDSLVSEAKDFLAELDRRGGKIVTLTYKPARHSPAVVEAAVKEQFPEIATHVKTVESTLLITGAESDAQAALEHAKAVDLSLVTRAESVEEYAVQSRYLRGLERLAQQAFPEVTVTGLPQTKVLVIAGPEEPVARCLEKVRVWDTASQTETVTENYRVLYQEPDYLAETLQGLKLAETFTATASGEMLALTGPSVAVSEAVAVLRDVDQPTKPGQYGLDIVSERFVLEWANVTEAMQMLAATFGEKTDMTIPTKDSPSVQVDLTKLAEAQGIPIGPTNADGSPSAPDGVYLFGQGGAYGGGSPFGGAPILPPPGSQGGLLDGTGLGMGDEPAGDEGSSLGGAPPAGGGSGGASARRDPTPVRPDQAVGGVPSLGMTGDLEIWLSVGVDRKNHALLVSGPRWAVKRAVGMLEQFDQAPHQLVLECVIADVNTSYLKDKGVDWDFGNVQITEADGNTIGLRTFSRSGFGFNGTIALEAQNSNAKLLASPKLACLDGGTAHIQIGDTLRYRVLQLNPGGTATYTTETQNVGILLDFVPRITGDGHVVLEMTAESSSIAGYVDGIPQTRTRVAQTEVSVRDGETFVLGGLIREEEIDSLSTVPFLSDIPVLGQLFRHRKIEKRPQELVFFITPRVTYATDSQLRDGTTPRDAATGEAQTDVYGADLLEGLSSEWTALSEHTVPGPTGQQPDAGTPPAAEKSAPTDGAPRADAGALSRIGRR